MNAPEAPRKDYTQPDPEVFAAWRERDAKAGALIVSGYMDYVAGQADRFKNALTVDGGVVGTADLRQDGIEKVLADARENYDPSKGSFFHYIKRRAPGYITSQRIGHGGAVYVSEHTAKIILLYKREVAMREQVGYPALSDQEIAALLGIPLQPPKKTLPIPPTTNYRWTVRGFRTSMAVYEAESLDQASEKDPRKWEAATPVAERGPALSLEELAILRADLRRLMDKAFAPRPTANTAKKASLARERAVILLRFGLVPDGMPRTQEEVAQHFGVTDSLIGLIEKRALARLRAVVDWPY